MAEKEFDREGLEGWLKIQPREVSLAIASRAALRGVGAFEPLVRANPKVFATYGLLPALRAMAVPRAAAMNPGRGTKLATAARCSATDSKNAEPDAAYVDAIAAAATFAARAAVYIYAGAARAAASAAASSVAYSTTRAAASPLAVAKDRIFIGQGNTAAQLAMLPLWHDDPMPPELSYNWQKMRQTLLDLDQDWDVWTEWYEDRLHGRPEIEDLEIARLTLPEELWEQGPEAVNPAIKRLIEEYEPKGAVEGTEEGPREDAFQQESAPDFLPLPEVPGQKAASLEPIWLHSQLVLPNTAADTAFRNTEHALHSLRQGFQTFLEDLQQAENTNLDQRIVDYIRMFVSHIPQSPPTTDELLSFGQHETVLKNLASVARSEWPDIFAFRFEGLNLQLDRTLKKFPDWVDFVAEEKDFNFS